MPEESQENKIPKNIKRTRKWVWCTAIVIVIAAIICLLFRTVWKYKSVDEQLAAIEAARAIPDEENAAIIYNQLLEDYNNDTESEPNFFADGYHDLTFEGPWLSKDHPEIAEWLEGQQSTIATLTQASNIENCRFPIVVDSASFGQSMERLPAMRQWLFLLIRAANNDIAEGRIDAGIQKYRCLIKMSNHLCQQPVMLDHLVGFAIEGSALSRMKTFILEGDATEKHLKTFEAALPQTKDNWAEISSKITEFETLYERKNVGFLGRVRYWRLWRRDKYEKYLNRTHEIYLRLLAERRGNRILIALRRYKNKHDRWPESLDQIKSSLPQEILTDPHNNGPFVYKLTDNTFRLYSKGKNNVDEDGRYRDPQDDWPIWPPRNRKTKEENTDVEQQ